MEPIEAVPLEPVADLRPEPGPFPDLWVVRYMEWRIARQSWERDEWVPRLSMFPFATLEKAKKEAVELIAKGCLDVRPILIPGDKHGTD